jgi:glycosyltransferase involved in cell wall biosynthesis
LQDYLKILAHSVGKDRGAGVQFRKGIFVKISAFTIVRNATILEYPVVESILSILPIVDEYVVLVGKSDDNTLDLIKGIGSDKIHIVEDEWRDDLQQDGLFFSRLTNIALEKCTGDWAFSLQADEVIHEKDLPALKQQIERCDKDPAVRAISLRFYHFYGDYWTYNPYGHRKACRIIRNNGEVINIWDGVAFALRATPETRLLEGPPEHIVKSPIYIYHYSWVKDPSKLLQKFNILDVHYRGDKATYLNRFDFDLRMVKRFRGNHPKVMEQRIAGFGSPLPPYRSRWLKLAFYPYLLAHGYKG